MKKYKGKSLVILIFDSAMAVFYLIIGLTLIFWQKSNTVIENEAIRMSIGILLSLYGIFRVYRAIIKIV